MIAPLPTLESVVYRTHNSAPSENAFCYFHCESPGDTPLSAERISFLSAQLRAGSVQIPQRPLRRNNIYGNIGEKRLYSPQDDPQGLSSLRSSPSSSVKWLEGDTIYATKQSINKGTRPSAQPHPRVGGTGEVQRQTPASDLTYVWPPPSQVSIPVDDYSD